MIEYLERQVKTAYGKDFEPSRVFKGEIANERLNINDDLKGVGGIYIIEYLGEEVYIGKSINIFKRLSSDHTAIKKLIKEGGGKDFDIFVKVFEMMEEVSLMVEPILIRKKQPRLNKQYRKVEGAERRFRTFYVKQHLLKWAFNLMEGRGIKGDVELSTLFILISFETLEEAIEEVSFEGVPNLNIIKGIAEQLRVSEGDMGEFSEMYLRVDYGEILALYANNRYEELSFVFQTLPYIGHWTNTIVNDGLNSENFGDFPSKEDAGIKYKRPNTWDYSNAVDSKVLFLSKVMSKSTEDVVRLMGTKFKDGNYMVKWRAPWEEDSNGLSEYEDSDYCRELGVPNILVVNSNIVFTHEVPRGGLATGMILEERTWYFRGSFLSNQKINNRSGNLEEGWGKTDLGEIRI